MGFLTFIALVGLVIALLTLRSRLGEVRAAQDHLARALLEIQRRQEQLEYEWRDRQEPISPRPVSTPVPTSVVLPPIPSTPSEPAARPDLPGPIPPAEELPAIEEPVPSASWLGPADASSPANESFDVAARSFLSFFTTGNVVAKIGVIIVFFGVAFLLRYAAERGLLPIEYRLMATAAGALVLLGVGWHLRHSRTEYAVVLQGGAVGLLYLTIFAAYRLYELLPAPLTFALMLVVVALSSVLAVVQNAVPLAVLGTSGGFLAPILASTGAGSHVALFSYYAALNLGVLGIAWFRSWRFLNWLAFVFTFGIGFAWGAQYYQPALLTTTEPFLLFFFLLFIAVSVLFAHRQPPQLRGYIDGSLVFGLPAVAFGMQSVLVGEVPFGRAYSAAAVSALYLTLSRALWRRDPVLRPLAESFLALAVVFLVLVVPLAFDGHATAAAWALEGAGLVWIGIRQHRRLARWAGAALLIGAGDAFAGMATGPLNGVAVLNTRFLACIAIAVASVIAGLLLSKARERLSSVDRTLEWILLVWGLLWWFGATEKEILDHVPGRLVVSSALLGLAASSVLVAFIARRSQWRAMMLSTMPLGPLMWVWVVPLFVLENNTSPLANRGQLAWSAVIVSSYVLAFWFEQVWPRVVVCIWHVATAWLLMLLTTWALAVNVHHLVPETATWPFVIWCIVPALFVLAIPTLSRMRWPAQRFPWVYDVLIPAAPVVVMLMWFVVACGERGAAAPIAYVPLLNPLEITQAVAIIVAYNWWSRLAAASFSDRAIRLTGTAVLAGLAFIGINVVVARTVHFFLNVPFEFDDLMRSSVLQTGISILWGVTAAVLMAVARQQLHRVIWMVGAGLLGVLILKLFVIDLSNIGTVARIVSFLATGVLILLIGYFAPAPPRSATPQEQSA